MLYRTLGRDMAISSAMMPNTLSAFDHVVAQLNQLAEKLKAATNTKERRELLREYRTLLEEADRNMKAD